VADFRDASLKKRFFFLSGFLVRSAGAGKLFVLDFPIFKPHTVAIQNGDFQMPITLSQI
jgi:hypothetical protein